MSYQDTLHKDQRLVLLRTLAELGSYRGNESVLQTVLSGYGHDISRDLVVSHLRYLAEQGLVSLEDMGGITVATLLQRGHDVAAGRATVEGVKQPGPGR